MAKQIINPPRWRRRAATPTPSRRAGRRYSSRARSPSTPQASWSARATSPRKTEQAFKNLRTVVEACGGTHGRHRQDHRLRHRPGYRPAIAAARQKHFKGAYPASTYLVVSALAVPQLLVEVEAVAMI